MEESALSVEKMERETEEDDWLVSESEVNGRQLNLVMQREICGNAL